MKKNKQVSDLFIDIYLNFNVTKQTERIKQLTRRELILLLILAVDNFGVDNEVTISHYSDFEKEIDILYEMESGVEIKDEDILSLKEEFGSFIDSTDILDKDGNKIPNPLSEEEAMVKRRELFIDNITN